MKPKAKQQQQLRFFCVRCADKFVSSGLAVRANPRGHLTREKCASCGRLDLGYRYVIGRSAGATP